MPSKLTIKSCRSCNGKNFLEIISLGESYLSDFITSNDKPAKYPLDLILCMNCHLLQLKHTAPQSLLYTENYGYRSGINKTMQKELHEIVSNALKVYKDNKSDLCVVDIGANDGTLLSNYPETITRIGVEPIKKLSKMCKKHASIVVNDFFTYEAFKKKFTKKADIITVISCFYDMEEPNTFVADLVKILDENGVIIIQQNYLVSMLELNAFDNIVHEHLEYYSLLSLHNLLEKHGLEVFHVEENDLNGGSFRTYISLKGKRSIRKSVINMIEREKNLGLDKKKIYQDFAKRIDANKNKIHKFIKDQVKQGKQVFVYGASTRGNTLLQYYGLDNSLISYAVERNEEKWGKKIASVGIPIISEEEARKLQPDYMLVLPWFFKKEFLQREKAYLKHGGHFIFPLPSVEII